MISRATASRDRNFFLSLINKAKTLSHLNQTHAQIIHHNNLFDDNITITKLVQKLLDLKATAQAKLLFTHTKSPDLFLYNAIISGFGSELFVGSALVDMYMNSSRIVNAYKVFGGISEPDTVLWNTVISGLVKNCCYDEAIRVFLNMVKRTMRFDSTTLAVVLSAIAELQGMIFGLMVQSLAIKVGCHFHEHVLTCLISLYSKCGDTSTARVFFVLIGKPDLIAYNAMISGYSCNNKTELSVQLFKELLFSGERVNSSTMVALIPVFHPFGHLDLTSLIHGFCVKCTVSLKMEIA
ncbi:unnamed protein product [Fraxinus pennsylvanica]|uniref:Pentatricopeptide repeat-containing protein n=1 Tax=Fraxinus pennsylvanica TaxID=56036 RepID=A0AAD2A7H8_9LAMI|nr:unnamed protein product [Fraxinus pennsylvanica]